MAKGKILGIDTNTMLLVLGGAAVLYIMTRPKYTPPMYARPGYPPSGSSAATTAAEIAAGGAVVSTLIDDLFSSNTVQGIYHDGEF